MDDEHGLNDNETAEIYTGEIFDNTKINTVILLCVCLNISHL